MTIKTRGYRPTDGQMDIAKMRNKIGKKINKIRSLMKTWFGITELFWKVESFANLLVCFNLIVYFPKCT